MYGSDHQFKYVLHNTTNIWQIPGSQVWGGWCDLRTWRKIEAKICSGHRYSNKQWSWSNIHLERLSFGQRTRGHWNYSHRGLRVHSELYEKEADPLNIPALILSITKTRLLVETFHLITFLHMLWHLNTMVNAQANQWVCHVPEHLSDFWGYGRQNSIRSISFCHFELGFQICPEHTW